MLRQALDAAKGQHQQQTREAEDQSPTETDSLLPDSREQNYAATATPAAADTNVVVDEDDGNESQLYEDEDYGDWDQGMPPPPEDSFCEKMWKGVKGCIVLVVNVENLWDSPDMNGPHAPRSRKNKFIVLFWFFILASSYATERSTFKFLVDRTCPFRLFAIQMVTFSHALMIGLGMFISACSRKDFTMQTLGVPIVDVGLMALLDTVHLLLVFLTGPHVSPTLTVILVQFTLPLTAIFTQFVHPDGFCARRCCRQPRQSESIAASGVSPPSQPGNVNVIDEGGRSMGRALPGYGGLSLEHILGLGLITLAVLLALAPAMYSILDPDFFVYADTIPMRTAVNTFLFVSGCVPAAASQLYKEHIFLQYKQPVQSDYLNFILSIFQFIFASIMSPLVFSLQGLRASDDWPNLYPSNLYSTCQLDGMECFLGLLDEDRASNDYYDEANCSFALALVFLHCFSIICVGIAVDKIVNAGATKVMYRGISAGIILATILLYIYDMHIPDFSYGPAIDSLNLICVSLLVVGAEVYHRVGVGATFETVFPDVTFYDEE